MLTQRCFYCTSPATLLCDGKTTTGTCDRPMCARCVAKSSPFIACSRGNGAKARTGTIDYCPDCANAKRKPSKPFIAPQSCRLCQSPISIPGLDASLCPRCGWVLSPEHLISDIQKTPRKTRSRQRKEGA